MSETYISAELRRLVAARAEGLCEYCLIHEEDTFFGCEVDHIISEKPLNKPSRWSVLSRPLPGRRAAAVCEMVDEQLPGGIRQHVTGLSSRHSGFA